LLFAGTTSFPYGVSFNYSVFNEKVKKLKQWSKSAGNIFTYVNYGTSETLSNETVEILENVKEISVHVPRHLKPINQDQFGHYLAGLIDGSGQFNDKQELIIDFHALDASLAYFIKKRLGYGSVKKITTRNSYILVVSSSEGLKKAINLINGKFRSEKILNQINTKILNNNKFTDLKTKINLKNNLDTDLKNHWLAGFSDATASFNINLFHSDNKLEVQLNFNLVQERDNILLLLIKEFLGGNLSYSKDKDTHFYDSSSFGSAKKVIDYLDHYHLLSTKQINYLK
jgi:hypothetical protein